MSSGRSERQRKAQFAAARKARQAGTAAPTVPVVPSASPLVGEHEQTPRCGLCGKTGKLTRTECCRQWICDDEDSYVMFSYARNSCYRNHRRYTLCGTHHAEGHDGAWQTCQECRNMMEPELYVHYGTNEFNFEKLKNPPTFSPTLCRQCKRPITLAEGGYSMNADGYLCGRCTEKKHGRLF